MSVSISRLLSAAFGVGFCLLFDKVNKEIVGTNQFFARVIQHAFRVYVRLVVPFLQTRF